MQQTDFPFEVIVHDDASPDGTPRIIREFEEKYPDIIRPIYQKENQYSKPDTPIIQKFMLPKARGKYLAFCEGDDYFIHPEKLQRQVDFLEQHSEYSICVHRAVLHREGADGEDDLYPAESGDREFSREEIIVRGAGLFATNSFLFRRAAYEELPDAFFISGVGDYPLLFHAAVMGKVWYMGEAMSQHNEGVSGSWTDKIWANPGLHESHEKEMQDFLDRVDRYYGGAYHREIDKAKAYRLKHYNEYRFEFLKQTGRVKEAAGDAALQPLYRAYQKQQRRAAIKKAFPFLAKLKQLGGGGHGA